VTRHDVITINKMGERSVSSKIGSYFKTKTDGCYKLVLDYLPRDSNAPILVIVGTDADDNEGSIYSGDWIFSESHKTHSVYGYTPFGNSENKEAKKMRQRIGTVFSTKSDHVYSIALNLWPMSPDTDILCIEIDPEDAFKADEA